MDPNLNPSNNNAEATDDETSKRQALQGQWRTPPLPIFPSSQQQQQQQQQQQHPWQPPQPLQQQPPPPPTASGITLPESTDDYARALEEAYRRGAEAAAAMQQQQHAMPNAVSCPNFHQLPVAPADPTTQTHHQPQPVLLVPNPLTTTTTTTTTTMEHGSMPPPTILNTTTTERSFSLPDMASYAARAQVEEEKRKKRLARNRASARLRRLRKKNLVDSYEGEVGVLELGLQKLRAHEWGEGHSHEALLEALGMERGQQPLSLEERSKLIQDILEQQSQQVAFLRDVQLEQQVLQELVSNPDNEDPLLQELKGVLDLSPEQVESLQHATSGLSQEVEAMETLESCLEAMKQHQYIQNDSVHNISQQFMSIFHANQVSKFLLWTDNNAEAIDQLDYCHAAGEPANAPAFGFGMDDYGGASQLTSMNTGMDGDMQSYI